MKSFSISLLLFPVVCLLGCQNNPGSVSEQSIVTDSLSYTGERGDAVKLVKTASVNFKVKDVEKSVREVSALAGEMGGTVFDRSLSSDNEDRRELKAGPDSLLVIYSVTPKADMLVRVPSVNLESFMYRVAAIGYHTGSSNLHIDDKSLVYLENGLKQRAEEMAAAQAAGKGNFSSLSGTLKIKEQAIEHHIDNRMIDADVAYSTVNISFFQNTVVFRETIANYNLADYQLPFAARLREAVATGWSGFLGFLLLLVDLWVLILLGVVLFFFYRYSQNKNKAPVGTN